MARYMANYIFMRITAMPYAVLISAAAIIEYLYQAFLIPRLEIRKHKKEEPHGMDESA